MIPNDARFEIKFVDYQTKLPQIQHWLKLHPANFREHYPDRTIHNIYFDTHDYDAYAENLSGVSNRQKLRYRWYGDHITPQAGQLELKKRRNLLGWKEIRDIEVAPYEEGTNWRGIVTRLKQQINHRERLWLHANPFPILTNVYTRKYFISGDGATRLTVDNQFKVWDQRFKSTPNFSHASNVALTVVIEVKCDRTNGEILSAVLQGLPVRVGRHSKYITGIKSFQSFLG